MFARDIINYEMTRERKHRYARAFSNTVRIHLEIERIETFVWPCFIARSPRVKFHRQRILSGDLANDRL